MKHHIQEASVYSWELGNRKSLLGFSNPTFEIKQ